MTHSVKLVLQSVQTLIGAADAQKCKYIFMDSSC